MIFDVQPIANVPAVAIDGQLLALDGVEEHQGDELLRELVGAVVVGAIRDQGWQAIGFVIGSHKVICGRFGGRIWGIGSIWRSLHERTGRSQCAIDFIRRDV